MPYLDASKVFGPMPPCPFFIAVLVASFLAGCSFPRSSLQTARINAPDFVLPDAHGTLRQLSDYRGKVLLLDFWATWCGPCRIQIPWFNQLALRYRDRGLAVLGVSMDERGWQAVDPFVRELKVNYPVVLGNDRVVGLYGVGPPPTTFLIDRDGKIAVVHAGLASRNSLENEVQQLLRAPAPSGSAHK
jgi:peroxiredoxin